MTIRAVFFDIGETLIDETRIWEGWARYLEIAPHDFLASLLAHIERDGDPIDLIQSLRPGFSLHVAEAERAARGDPNQFDARDLYPDVREALTALRATGITVGLAGNQPARARAALEAMGLGAHPIIVSDEIGLSKPDPAFFAHLVGVCGCPPNQIVYVGDRLDNDVIPASAAGLRAAFIARGPWGSVHQRRPEVALAAARIASLRELPGVLAAW